MYIYVHIYTCTTHSPGPTSAMQLLMCVPLLLQMEAENQVNTANLLTATVVYNVYTSYHKLKQVPAS